MAQQPEQQARGKIEVLLEAAGWHAGEADYLLYVDGKAAGVIEAKKEGVTLTGVETQSDKYTKGLPAGLPRSTNPMSSLHC